MNPELFLADSDTQANKIDRATVLEVRPDGTVTCACDGDDLEPVVCQVLHSSEGPALQLVPGDVVLVWQAGNDVEGGVILGRLGGPRASAPQKKEIPEELILEARQGLTLKCGEGSITLREDGKILIKGKDLVSRAKRVNRIKGGSVAIN